MRELQFNDAPLDFESLLAESTAELRRRPQGDFQPDFGGGLVDITETDGYSVIKIPPELISLDLMMVGKRIEQIAANPRSRRSRFDHAVHGILSALAGIGKRGRRVTALTIVLGLLLAVAQVRGVVVQTHPRDLAKEAKVRYQTLLLIRRIAVPLVAKWDLCPYLQAD